MAIGKNGAVGRELRTILGVGTVGELTDGQLLERYSTGRGAGADSAFEAIVDRHGPMVLRVCRGILADPNDALDASQATFLVLIRRSRSLWVEDSLGPWLHQVAYRTAKAARSAEARRRRLDRSLAPADRREPIPDELNRALHEEIERLPDRFRAPIVLCDLEGGAVEQAARHLGVPVGTVKSRLSRGRDRLRGRLRRRGFAPVIPALPRMILPIEPLIRSLGAPGVPRRAVDTLAFEVLRSMKIARCLKVAATLFFLGASATGVTLLAQVGPPSEVERPKAEVAVDDPAVVEFRAVKIRSSERYLGLVESSKTLDVLSEVEGVRQIVKLVPEGTAVREGDLVCEIDSAELRDHFIVQGIATKQAEAAYQNAVNARQAAAIAIDEYNQGTFPGEEKALQDAIDEGRFAVKQAEDRLKKARAARQKLQDMLAQKGGPQTPADLAAELDFDGRIDEAERARLREGMAGARSEARLATLRTQTKTRVLLGLQAEAEARRDEETAKQSAWELGKAREAKLKNQFERCRLRAPADGLIVYAKDPSGRWRMELGASVRERQRLFSIPDLAGRPRVNVKVAESSVGRVKTGQTARMRILAFPGREIAGHVVSVSPIPDPPKAPGDVGPIYTVLVVADDNLNGWRPGMTGDVDLLLDDFDEALGVPTSSLLAIDGKAFVAVRTPGGTFERRAVVTGPNDGAFVRVQQGLRPGEKVALDPALALKK